MIASNNHTSSHFYLDSACTQHICNDKSLFHDFQSKTTKLLVPGNTTIETMGFGTIKLKIQNLKSEQYEIVKLHNVAYQPNCKNLISTGLINRKGFHLNTVQKTMFNTSNPNMLYKIIPENNLIYLQAEPIKLSQIKRKYLST